ncbi:aspartyl-phosphate phosphatase Spo0E family protein [Bacillus thermotolerans]|uniref:Aspartyl-phosphate phosphatase Spo0E family protein n=1 Tax=Bacillus thermotolerans TaxID=1221996 RepID=A0A0F5I0N5_BACTR|nr:aspartyl-phosphate phosphatase Spo0E family protein [Bacillus thermotolerans]KKB38865.1 hypothetical protein QY97_01108 [Bacillus thermotolerans]KKB42467.1 hypothetical protein QY95_00316 [Bacillus thermotolerans]KKB44585.1 hypothetical protein QY96_02205 [Bacillus thermotolerans]
MRKDELLDAIERKRTELFKVVAANGLSSPLAVKYSQELDHLLNHYDSKYTRVSSLPFNKPYKK